MGYISHCPIFTFNQKSWEVNSKPSGIDTKIMKTILSQFEAMQSYHNKIFLLRLDLRQYNETTTNRHISTFITGYLNAIKLKYKLLRCGYVWVREKEKANQQHYHLVILLDGNKVQRPKHILDLAKHYWEVRYDGSISWPSKR